MNKGWNRGARKHVAQDARHLVAKGLKPEARQNLLTTPWRLLTDCLARLTSAQMDTGGGMPCNIIGQDLFS